MKNSSTQNTSTKTSFGMIMSERSFSSEKYRYGFNGKEKTDEINGEGVMYDYGFRIYDSRLGRFLSVDPLSMEYPWNSTYSFAENRVIDGIDLDGKEWQRTETTKKRWFRKDITIITYTVKLKVLNCSSVKLSQDDVNTFMAEVAVEMQMRMNLANTNKYVIYQFKIEPVIVDLVSEKDFYIELYDAMPEEKNEDEKKEIDGSGGKIKAGSATVGTTQSGHLRAAVQRTQGKEKFNKLVVERVKVVHTVMHELGHTAGLGHVFDEDNPLYNRWLTGELDDNMMSYPSKARKSEKYNLNPITKQIEELENKSLVQEQLDIIDKTVIAQQPKTN